jgi:superoxide dismutase
LERSGGAHINHSLYWRSMCKGGSALEQSVLVKLSLLPTACRRSELRLR